MTTPTTALVFYLRADPAVAALVQGRVWQILLPQPAVLPAVVLTTVSEPEAYQLRGVAGVTPTRVQVDCYADERDGVDAKAEVDAVAAAVDTALSGRRVAAAEFLLSPVLRVNRIDSFEAEEVRAFRVMLEYVVSTRLALRPSA